MIYKTHRNRPGSISQKDKTIWEASIAGKDLLDYLYTGLPGFFQRKGHKIIHRWSQMFTEKIILEIGCGHGHHLTFENNYRRYYGLDISRAFLKTANKRHSDKIIPIQGDITELPFLDKSVDAIICVYTLEHVRNLPQAIMEIRRILKDGGSFLVGIPCEGGFCYNVGREFTSKPYMEKKYGLDYDAIIKYEHCNEIWDILKLLKENFTIKKSKWIPLNIPIYHINIISCFECISN